jgi:hypothetical protein
MAWQSFDTQREAKALQRTEWRRYAKEMQFVETLFDETQWPGKGLTR